MKSVRMLAVSFYHLNLGVKTGFPLKAFIATSISIPKFPPYLDPNFRPFNMFFGEVSGVTFSFHSSLPCLWAIIGGHFCFIFITLRGSKASEKPGWFDVDAVGNGGQYHFSGTFWYNLAALAGGMGEIIMKNCVESNGTSWNAMHVVEFPLLKTQTCTSSSSKKTKSNNNTFNILFFTSHKFQTSKPSPLSNDFFPTQFPQSFPGVPSTLGLHLGLCRLSNSQLLGCHRGTHADGHGTRADLRVTDPGRRSVTGVVWRWEEWGWNLKEVKQILTVVYQHFAMIVSCVVMWKDPT